MKSSFLKSPIKTKELSMLAYFKGCAGSLISTISLFFIVLPNPDLKLLAMLTPFIFIGGIFGSILFRILHVKNVSNFWLQLLCFALLGGLFAWMLHFFLPFYWFLTLITVVGSVSFFLVQLIKHNTFGIFLAIMGPLVSLILGFATRNS